MAVLNVSPIDKDEDNRSYSQYLTSHPITALEAVFVDSNPEQWIDEIRRTFNLARELANRLTQRALEQGLVMSDDLDKLRIPQARSLLRRLVEWLYIDKKIPDSQQMFVYLQQNMPQVIILEYFRDLEKPDITNLCTAKAFYDFLQMDIKIAHANGLTSRMIYINLGRHNIHFKNDMLSRFDCFDYCLVWLGALFELLGISSDLLLTASLRDYNKGNKVAGEPRKWVEQRLPPSFKAMAKKCTYNFQSQAFFVPCAAVLASHETERTSSAEPVSMIVRPTLLVSHFHEPHTDTTQRPWTGMSVAASNESWFLRQGDYATEDCISEAILQGQHAEKTICSDPTKPLSFVYMKFLGSVLECLGSIDQFLDSFEILIRRRPFDLNSDSLFHTMSLLKEIEIILTDYRSDFFLRIPSPESARISSWTDAQTVDLDFTEEQLRKIKSHVSETRTLLFNTISILESQQVAKLTAIAFVFIPITFVATIFGMNVSIFASSDIPISTFVIAAVVTSSLTFATTIGYKPTVLVLRRILNYIKLRLVFRKYLWHLKRQVTGNFYTAAPLAALDEKRESYQALLNIIGSQGPTLQLQNFNGPATQSLNESDDTDHAAISNRGTRNS